MGENAFNEETMDEASATQRPVVVSILAVVMALNGILTLINGLSFQAGPLVIAMGAIAILLSLGLWQLWSWAWIGTIVLQFIAVGFALYDWITGVGIDFLAIAIGIFVVLYLLRSEVRAAFFK
ncbi:MAG: hypothetical protein GWP61_05475 [Chloroflexi bacterium]|jgi:uncharacterized membrane protein (DUF2068 family)|nr:hypothetical protein [Chloroflexota bacterium]